MKIVRFEYKGKPVMGLLEKDRVRLPGTGSDGVNGIMPGGFSGSGSDIYLDRDKVSLLAPCLPSKVVCVGLNYRGHAEELGLPLPKSPILFIKPSTAVIGPGETIIRPSQSKRVDYEAELGVVIGRRACHVPPEKAPDYVLGYTCANDVTARDLQPADGQWTYAKSFDTFAPLGPWIETSVNNPDNLQVKGILNGHTVQLSTTADLIFGVRELVSFISCCMTLLPGDVIMTGTPAGIGPLKDGDIFGVEIEGVGHLTNPFTDITKHALN